MIAKYLEIPLRFPIKFLGSRSTFRVCAALRPAQPVMAFQDDVSPALPDRDRESVERFCSQA